MKKKTETTTTKTPCAWCGDAKGKETTHGICERHAEQQLGCYYWERLQSVPSYVERLSNKPLRSK